MAGAAFAARVNMAARLSPRATPHRVVVGGARAPAELSRADPDAAFSIYGREIRQRMILLSFDVDP
ncbi:hypothetical protein WMF39_42705 [Sorangium sp. So ce1504]|uniref:hypothetical protein n=1 Tax=Sorangium sp. So ce1504 TaxID=3133337 RepID=UPI003F5D7BAD